MTITEAVTAIYKKILSSPLVVGASGINGQVCPWDTQPLNSTTEDIVILPLTGLAHDVIQRGIFIVNIHVPNMAIPMASGEMDYRQPNTKRLSELDALASTSLTDVSDLNGEWEFTIQQTLVARGDNNDHFLNVRLDFYSQLEV